MQIHPIDLEAVTNAKELIPEDELLSLVVECFQALADNTRTKILYALRKQPLSVRDLAITVGISESAMSHQLSTLKDKRLVKAERKANVMLYSISYLHLKNLLKEAENYADHVKSGIMDHPYK
jgi:ArsR family transcriptional regulator, lead/cadmium/zinc/bismuth-responsive transcriptional repressor